MVNELDPGAVWHVGEAAGDHFCSDDVERVTEADGGSGALAGLCKEGDAEALRGTIERSGGVDGAAEVVELYAGGVAGEAYG